MRAGLRAVALTVVAIAAVVACQRRQQRVLTLVPAEMRASGAYTKDADKRVTFWGNGALEAPVDLTGGLVKIIISGRGNYANGEWPTIQVELDSQIVAVVPVRSAKMQDYTVYAEAPHSGSNRLRVEFGNHSEVPGEPLAGRNLTVGRIVVEEPARVLTLVAAELRGSGPYTKDAARGVTFWGNGVLEADLDLGAGPVLITVTARGNYADGDWPMIYIELDDHIVVAVPVDSNKMRDYTVRAEVPHLGANLLRLRLVNYDVAPGQPLASRNLTVARIALEQP
jgi:hypothetical protein